MDEAWIETAISTYQRLERLAAGFDAALADARVTVRSSDGLVEVVVRADGTIHEVVISDEAHGRSPRDLSRSVQEAVEAAGDAAQWARQRLYRETFGQFGELASRTSGSVASLTGRVPDGSVARSDR